MSDVNEPSYYEVALTNRQVLVSFVLLLGCILVAFVFGVWVGKEGSDPALDPMAAGPSEVQEMATLEELQFSGGASDGAGSTSADEAGGDLDKPDLSSLFEASQDSSGTTLAQDVGSARRPVDGGASTSTPQPSPPPPSSPPKQQPPPPAAAPAATAATTTTTTPAPAPSTARAATPPATQEGFIVQVFSSHDKGQAQKVLDQMRQGGYRSFLSPLRREGSSQVMYRVRLGPFSDRPPADAAAADVTRQYKLETWVTAASN